MDQYMEQIASGMVHLTCESSAGGGGVSHVHLIGTIHLSQESCNRVKDAINNLKPQVVFLELCKTRFDQMTTNHDEDNSQAPTFKELLHSWIKGNTNFLAFLHFWYIIRMLNMMKIPSGIEFRVAYQEARNCGAEVYLGDRPVNITLDRICARLSFVQKILFVSTYLYELIFFPTRDELENMLIEMDRGDFVEAERSLEACHPIHEVLVQERDMYMSDQLLEVARQSSSVVAVVGKAHLTGIVRHWISRRPSQVDAEQILPKIEWRSSTIILLVFLGAILGTFIAIFLQWKRS